MEAMEIGKEGATTVAKQRQKLAVEEYLDFFDNRTHDLNVGQLRQIIGMHGFKRIAAPKKILIDMVTTMDLMDLHRSTLLDGAVSCDARLTLKEVISDLKCIDWQECHVTSLLTQRAAGSATPSSGSAADAASGGTVSVKRKRRKKLKKLGETSVDHSVISTTGTNVAAGSTTESERCVDCNSPEI